jgi:hypothetical protein
VHYRSEIFIIINLKKKAIKKLSTVRPFQYFKTENLIQFFEEKLQEKKQIFQGSILIGVRFIGVLKTSRDY